MSNSSNSNSQSTYKIVTYQEFESSFKRTHPKLKYNEARKQFNAAWEKLKKDHGCDKIKSHKKRVKHWSSEFHTAAGEQIKQWKLQFEKKKLQSRGYFFGLYKDKPSNNKKKRNVKQSCKNNNIERINHNKKRKIKSKAEKAQEFVSKLNELQSFKQFKNSQIEGLFNWIEIYYGVNEYKQFNNIICNPQTDKLIRDLNHLKYSTSVYYAHIVASNLFTTSLSTLNTMLQTSDGYKLFKNDINNEYKDIVEIIMKNKEFINIIKSKTNEENYKCVCMLFDIAYFVKIERILQSIKLNQLQNNYINTSRQYRTQDMVIKDIRRLDTLIFNYSLIHTVENKNRISELTKNRDKLVYELNRKQKMAVNSRKYRKGQHEFYRQLEHKYGITIIRTRSGPRRCEERPGNEKLMQILQNMVDEYCLADPRRQSETSICMSSIPQVVAHLKELGITISESSAIRRFEPSLKTSNCAKKYHTKCIKAKIGRIKNNGRKEHPSARYNFAWRKLIKELVSYIGKSNAAYVGQDDKDQIKMATTILLKTKKRILSTEHPNTSCDHNFPKGRKLKIIVSVQKVYEIVNVPGSSGAITYRGKTRIILRSSVSDSSTAPAHGLDTIEWINDEKFAQYFINPMTNKIVSIIVFEVDGGPDENIRFLKTILTYLLIFLKFQFDTLIVTICVPGWSALNMIERMMSHINEMITGLELEAFHFGNPLDSKGICKPDKKDMMDFNVEHAMIKLVNTLNKHKNDDQHISAEYKPPPQNPKERDVDFLKELFKYFASEKDLEIFLFRHFRPGQYTGQFVSCLQRYGPCKYCLKEPRGDYFNINRSSNNFPFLPSLIAIHHKDGRLKRVDPKIIKDLPPKSFRYTNLMESLQFDTPQNSCIDMYNPAVTTNMIEQRTCIKCGHYSVTKKQNQKHMKLNICGKFDDDNKNEEIEHKSVLDLFNWCEPSQDITDKAYIKDHKQNSLYLIQYEDKTQEWISLNPNHCLVIEYNKTLSLKNDEKEEKEDFVPLKDLHVFLNFDRFTNLTDIDEDSACDNDPFDDELIFSVESEKENERQERRTKEIVYNPQLPDIKYKPNDKYKYYDNESTSSDDDAPITSYILTDKRRNMVKKMIPSLNVKKKKTLKVKKKVKKKKSPKVKKNRKKKQKK